MAQPAQVEELHGICRECTSVPVDDLVRNEKSWGSITFEESQPKLYLAYNLCEDLLRLPVNILPEKAMDAIIGFAVELQNVMKEIREFNIAEGNAGDNRDAISARVSDAVDNFFEQVQHWISYLAYSHGDFETSANRISANVKQSNDELEKLLEHSAKKKAEVDEIVTAAKEASAKAGVAHFTQDFQMAAESLQASARNWLIATSVLAIVTLVSAYLLFDAPPAEKTISWAYVIHQTTTRLIFLGTLITATIWCGKTYRALKHQAATNKHRADALKTFQAFVQATSNDSIRDAVLLEATRAIFDLRPSGYLDQEAPSGRTEQMRIVETPKQPLNPDK